MNNLQTNNKFTIGSKIRLKPTANHWSDEYYSKTWEYPNEPLSVGDNPVCDYVRQYPDDFELVEATSERHIHYDMIVEWAANHSRVVQYWNTKDCAWYDAPHDNKPAWNPETRYRFKPEESARIFPTTSLTDNELTTLFDVTLGGVADALRAIANEAIKRYILELDNK